MMKEIRQDQILSAKHHTYPSVLTIAGFDGSGGAGIQGDMKTISALGCYATSVLTALPVQNTCGVRSIHPIPAAVVQEQLLAILDDIPPDAIKIGMVNNPELVEVISDALQSFPEIPVIFDPVMVASSGRALMTDPTIATIIKRLFPLSTLITPNLDEASVLTGMKINTVEEMYLAGEKVKTMGCRSLLLKGGHLQADILTSLYFAVGGQVTATNSERIETINTHGTGCTLSSAIASYIARGFSIDDAVKLAQKYVHQAILHGREVRTGKGKGPLNHFFKPEKLIKNPRS